MSFSGFTFLHLTDTHVRADTPRIRNVDSARAISDIPRLCTGSHACVIHTGDLINRPADLESYRHYEALVRSFPWPVHHVPGNHDDPSLMAQAVTGVHRDYPWLALVQGVRFIGLDSSASHLDEAQLQRLELLLNRNDDEPVILCVHHHLLPIGDSWLDPYRLENATGLLDRVSRSKARVLAVLHGHTHYHNETLFDSIPVYAGGACAANFDPFGAFQQTSPEPPSVTECHVHADGRITRRRIFLPQTDTTEVLS